ncbi:unnamed protein product [Heterobilharzia americana]|nr:unnamed protein product [Heterobilharzia americana]
MFEHVIFINDLRNYLPEKTSLSITHTITESSTSVNPFLPEDCKSQKQFMKTNNLSLIILNFITGSYDRTCKVWETNTGNEVHTLEGHRNVVYAIAFNLPFSDKIATGSFDKTARLWSAETGECHYIFQGHTAEVVCIQFNPTSNIIATGSMDTLAKLWM